MNIPPSAAAFKLHTHTHSLYLFINIFYCSCRLYLQTVSLNMLLFPFSLLSNIESSLYFSGIKQTIRKPDMPPMIHPLLWTWNSKSSSIFLQRDWHLSVVPPHRDLYNCITVIFTWLYNLCGVFWRMSQV